MENITGFLKQKVYQFDGIQITVGMLVLVLLAYWFVIRPRMK